MSENEGLQSLHGESKKIPVNLPNDKLSMSQLSDFARETQYFKNDYKSPGISQKKANLKINNSIAEVEDEDYMASRGGSRKAARNENKEYSSYNRQVDQLDKLIEQDRGKSRGLDKNNSNHNQWGEMSSVNSDITKEIEDLLRKKGNANSRPPSHGNNYHEGYYNNNNNGEERPNSRLSNAAKQSLSRHGYEYGGASIATISKLLNYIDSGGGTYNTLDIDRIHDRNDNRLKNLKNLGVETINTNNDGDEDFSKLDMILNKYKQSRVI